MSVRVGLLTGRTSYPDWFVTALERMVAETDAEIVLLIADADRDPSQRTVDRSGVIDRLKSPLSDLKSATFGKPVTYHRESEIQALAGIDTVESSFECVGEYRLQAPPELVTEISERTDVLIHNGVGILTGEMLTAPEYGILSYHHGNIRKYRGGPPGLWEFLHRKETAGVTLQRLKEELDAGEILVEKSVRIRSATSWPEVLRRLYDASTDMLVTGVERVTDSAFEPTTVEELGTLYKSTDVGRRERIATVLETCRRTGRNAISNRKPV